jgi:hypothetical protein
VAASGEAEAKCAAGARRRLRPDPCSLSSSAAFLSPFLSHGESNLDRSRPPIPPPISPGRAIWRGPRHPCAGARRLPRLPPTPPTALIGLRATLPLRATAPGARQPPAHHVTYTYAPVHLISLSSLISSPPCGRACARVPPRARGKTRRKPEGSGGPGGRAGNNGGRGEQPRGVLACAKQAAWPEPGRSDRSRVPNRRQSCRPHRVHAVDNRLQQSVT